MRDSSSSLTHCPGGEPTGDLAPLDYGDDDETGADCLTCDDRGTRRLYLGGRAGGSPLGAHTLPCPACRAGDHDAALAAIWRVHDTAARLIWLHAAAGRSEDENDSIDAAIDGVLAELEADLEASENRTPLRRAA